MISAYQVVFQSGRGGRDIVAATLETLGEAQAFATAIAYLTPRIEPMDTTMPRLESRPARTQFPDSNVVYLSGRASS